LLSQAHSSALILLAGAVIGIGYGSVTPVFQTQIINSVERHRIGNANSLFFNSLELFRDFDGPLTTCIEYGHPGMKIAEISKEKRYSLIIMGRRGMSDVAKLLMGSVSNYVLHYAFCPVLIIRDPN